MAFGIIRKQLSLQKQLDEFLDYVSEAGLMLQQGIDFYLRDRREAFEEKLRQVSRIEHKGDDMRRRIERQLYVKTLIPESRGDVLELLEQMDTILDSCKAVLWQFEIEWPEFPEEQHGDCRELVGYSIAAVEAIVVSVRSFFRSQDSLTDQLHKVSYWETEADKVASRMMTEVFRREDVSLCHKAQLKDFIRRIDRIADNAEDVGDRLSIYAIKRML